MTYYLIHRRLDGKTFCVENRGLKIDTQIFL